LLSEAFMFDGPLADPRQQLLSDINAGDSAALNRLTERVRRQPELGRAIARFRGGVRIDSPEMSFADGLVPAGFQLDNPAAKAFVTVLTTHPAFTEERRLKVGLDVLGVTSADPRIGDVRRDAAELLVTGALALGALDMPETMIEPLMHVAFGAEAFSAVLRATLLGRQPLEPDTWPVIPDWLRDFGDPGRPFACVLGIQNALTDFMLAVRGTQSTSYADGITGLTPSVGCAGQTVAIDGTGFGNSQPSDVTVLFPHASGTCVKADVVSWSPTQIRVTAPPGVATGCVGFVRQQTSAGIGELASASDALAGELEGCLGLAASAAAQRLRTAGPIGVMSCPPCLPGFVNRFAGGGPTIAEFTANGATEITVEPDTLIILTWRTIGATSVDVVPIPGPVFFIPLSHPVPLSGSHAAGFFAGSRPAEQRYRLTATNSCGAVSRTITVRMLKAPVLKVARLEVVQTIQRSNNSVRLVAGKRTLVRVFVESGLTGGFNTGAGPNIQTGVTGRLIAFSASRGFGFDAGPPLALLAAQPVGSVDRTVATHSLNFELPLAACSGQVRLDVRVAVTGHEQDVGTGFVAIGTTDVTFIDQPTQGIEPMLVVDVVNGLAAPTLAQYNTALQQARTMYPIAETGFIVAPPMSVSTGSGRNLTTLGGWSALVSMLQTLPLVHGGAIRTAVVPRSLTYALNGMALPRIGAAMPAFAAQAGVPGTFAHEMGHTLGLQHAPCCTNFWDGQDGRLPRTTEDIGWDVPINTLIPAGSGEIMSYCGDRSRCAGARRWPSIVTWDLIFDTFPI
jgi:IPT/TIG domain